MKVKLTITTNIKGKENTVTYKGQGALFESASYSYYTLSDTPSYYKEATVNEDGSLSFSEVKGAEATTLTNAKTEFSTSSKYGDYQLDITSEDSEKCEYCIWCSGQHKRRKQLWTSPCGKYLEENGKLAWSTGFVTESHGNNTGFQRLCCHDGTDDQ